MYEYTGGGWGKGDRYGSSEGGNERRNESSFESIHFDCSVKAPMVRWDMDRQDIETYNERGRLLYVERGLA